MAIEESGTRLFSGFLPMDRHKRILGKIAAVGVLGLSANPPLNAQSVRDLARKTFPSVVLLVMQDAGGQPVSLGSGFFVGDGIIATNVHVVRGASSGQVKLVGEKRTYSVSNVLGLDAAADLVLLKVSDAHAHELPLGDSNEVAVGDAVYAIGNPEGLEGTFSQGIVSGIRNVGSDKLLQITAPISPGSSGGPVINGAGEVVGVAVATFSEGQNLNFAIPSSYLAALLKGIRAPRPLSDVKELQANVDSFARMSGAKSTDAVAAVDFKWIGSTLGGQAFSFTFRNQLQAAIKDVHFYVVFFEGDKKHGYKPLDYVEGMTCRNVVIPPNLAKYIEKTVNLDPLKSYEGECVYLTVPSGLSGIRRQEVRVLDFKFVE